MRQNAFGQPIGGALPEWTPRETPPRTAMIGRTCRLEPLDIARHAADLYAILMRGEMSMVKGAIADLQKELGPAITFAACQNTRRAIAASEGKTPDQIPQRPGVRDAPSGVVRLAALQEQGWSYIRS